MSVKNNKPKFRLFLVFVCTIFLFQNSLAQNQISFRQLSVNEGLSQNSAISIAQDSTGYLWIATQDGLNKYDGKNFKVFQQNFLDITRPDYSNLGQVYTDKDRNLWIIPSDKKLYKFNQSEQVFDSIPGVEDASTIFQDKDGNHWVGTFTKGLYKLEGMAHAPSKVLSSGEGLKTIYNIFQASDNSLLLSTDENIVQYDKRSGKSLKLPAFTTYNETIRANFSDIVSDKENVQWIGTFGQGLFFRKKDDSILQRISELSFSDPLPIDLNILDLHIDSKDRLWIATYGRGLYLVNFNTLEIQHFTADKHNPRAIHYNDILCIYEDYSNTLWFGTDGAGLSYYDEYLEKFNSLTTFQTPESINIDVVRAIAVDSTKSIWIGTSGKGLTQYDPSSNSWRTFTRDGVLDNGISSNRIMSLLIDEENNLVVGTQGNGLDIFNGEEFENYSANTKVPLSANTIWTIYNAGKKEYWLGTRENGLIRFNIEKGETKRYMFNSKNEGLSSNNIRVITGDGKGNFWLGTDADGISFFDPKNETFRSYKYIEGKNSLSSDNVKSLYFDANEILWIGTNGGGLDAFDPKSETFYNYSEDDGLANNVIYAILPDDEGNLWLSSNKGVTKFTQPDLLNNAPLTTNYDNHDGLATEFNTGAYHIDINGNLYFGGLDGFYWFNPNEIKENRILPKTTITGLEVFNQERSLSPNMVLRHDENTLSFNFSSLQFSLPEKNQYQYKLSNYDEDWVSSGNTNFARYSHLPPGDYEFMVKSSNYDGIWNEQPISYKFSIAQPWYWNIWAKIIYTCLLALGVFAIYSYLKWRWRMRFELQQKEEEALRFKKLNDFKSKLYTDISHEFRTPLTLIKGPVDTRLSEGGLTETEYKDFSMIKRNTNRLIGLVDQLLHLAKLQKGNLKLKISEGDLGLFLSSLAKSFEFASEAKQIDFKIKVYDFGKIWYDEDAIEKIATNLLSNAVKYCTEKGKCAFEALQEEGNLVLNVSNSIRANSEIEIEKMFTRFYQQDEFSEGAGVGLALVKELVQLYGGEVKVKTDSKQTINFQVILPLKKSNLKNFEIVDEINTASGSLLPLVENKVINDPEDADLQEKLPILLIVEDHQEVRKFIGSIWNGQYQIVEAENGKVGMKKALETIPDLIISDVRMPICDGITLCNNLKADERTSHIPVILLTAGAGEENELKGLISGADDFIIKPFRTRVLLKRVENLIKSRKSLRDRYSQELVLKATDISVTKTDEVFLQKVQKVLDENLSDSEFDSSTFCEAVGMSRMQLHRKLMALTGLSTTAFIRSERLKQAVHILKTSDATINEVAYTIGFNTPSYFIKCFKETYKKTPSEYIQSTD